MSLSLLLRDAALASNGSEQRTNWDRRVAQVGKTADTEHQSHHKNIKGRSSFVPRQMAKRQMGSSNTSPWTACRHARTCGHHSVGLGGTGEIWQANNFSLGCLPGQEFWRRARVA